MTTNRPAVDRLLHGVWRSGLLHQQLAGDDFAGFEIPFALSAAELATLLDPRINNYAPGSAPAIIALRPLLPPTIEFDPEAERPIVVRMGELMLDLMLVPDGQDPVLVTSIAVFLDVSVDLGVEDFLFTLDFDAEARADLAEEPLFDLDDASLESLFVELAVIVPQVFEEGLEFSGESDFTWLELTDPQIEVHGIDDDRVSAAVGVEPNPEGFDEDPSL
jgi:hypothetical protein